MRINFREFEGGIWVRGPQDQNPQGTLRRARGIDTVRQNELRSRAGSSLIALGLDGNANAITYFADKFWVGTTAGKLYRIDAGIGVLVKEGFDGTKLRFIQAPPQVGLEDYLFVSGGGNGVGLIKIDKDSNISTWGIDPPPDGFIVEKAPQKEKQIADTTFTEWTQVTETGTTNTPATVSQLSPTAFKLAMNPKSLSAVQHILATPVNLKTLNPTNFDPFPGASEVDYVEFKLYVSDPSQLDFVQIGFDVKGNLFLTDYYTVFLTVVPAGEQFANVGPSADDTSKAQVLNEILEEKFTTIGNRFAGFDPRNPGHAQPFQTNFAARVEVRRTHGRAIILPVFGSEDIRPEVSTWTTIRVPIVKFHRSGTDETFDLTNVRAVRFYFRTKELNARTGQKIVADTDIHVDDFKLIGGYGTKGASYYHALTYRDSRTGSRSNPNPALVETTEVDRQAFILRKLPIGVVPPGVDQLEIWRTIGDGSQLFLARRFDIAELEADRNNPALDNYEGLTVGEAFDPIPDIVDFNRRDPIDADGQVSTVDDDTRVTFSDPVQGGKIRQDDLLVIDDERFFVVSKPGGNIAVLDHAPASTATSDFQWLAAATELGDIDTEGLRLDNSPPLDTFDDVVYHEARAWWLDTIQGNRGRLHFSPIGRPESYADFRSLASDREQLTRIIAWNGSLWAFSQERVYQVQASDDPVVLQHIDGAPGTIRPYTVVATPVGIIYQAADGIRVFNGTSSVLISDNISPLFHGRPTDGLPVFDGLEATSTEREYFIANDTTVLAIDSGNQAWRESKLPVTALEYIDTLEQLVAGRGGAVLRLEDPSVTTDNEVPIDFSVEPPAARLPSGVLGIVQRLYIEANTQGQRVTPTLITSSGEAVLPPFETPTRQTIEYALLRNTELVGVRLDAQLTLPLRVYGIELDVYVPGQQ